jgi:hypothetical protein
MSQTRDQKEKEDNEDNANRSCQFNWQWDGQVGVIGQPSKSSAGINYAQSVGNFLLWMSTTALFNWEKADE